MSSGWTHWPRLIIWVAAVLATLAPFEVTFAQPNRSEPLPAGLYWTGYDTCLGVCPRPGAAVVLAIEPTAESAQARVATLPSSALPVGYPLVVHSDELDLTDTSERGIVIILGLFEAENGARAWQGQLPQELAGSRVVALSGEPVTLHVEDGDDVSIQPRRIVRVQDGAPVPAYSPAAARDAVGRVSDPDSTSVDIVAAGNLDPICQIPGGSLFVVPVGELHTGLYYAFAPVRCDGQTAVVRWEDTLLDTTIWTDPNGVGHLRQVTGAECDSPFMTEWLYSPNGRGVILHDERGGSAGCW